MVVWWWYHTLRCDSSLCRNEESLTCGLTAALLGWIISVVVITHHHHSSSSLIML